MSEDLYKDFAEPVREYMRMHGGSPTSLMRILQRLSIPVPRDIQEAHNLIRRYIQTHGEEAFQVKMGLLRVPAAVPPPKHDLHPQAPPVLRYRDSHAPHAPHTIAPHADTGFRRPVMRPTPVPMPVVQQPHTKSPTPPARQYGMAGSQNPDVPEALRGIPAAAITPEALKAAQEGRCPFGPPPLIERRSGYDRRSGRDRRQNLELVFRNSRYGGDRRSQGDRRENPPPYRDPSQPTDDCIGNPELKAKGWVPDSLKPRPDSKNSPN